MHQVEELILGNLEQLAREGFTSTAVEAAVNSIEFSLRENNTGSFPRGLSLMLRAAAAWIYDRDPLEPLQWTDDLQRFKVLFPACLLNPCQFPSELPYVPPSCMDLSITSVMQARVVIARSHIIYRVPISSLQLCSRLACVHLWGVCRCGMRVC